MTANRITEHLTKPRRKAQADTRSQLFIFIGLDVYELQRVGLLGGWSILKQADDTEHRCQRVLIDGRLVWTCDCKGYQFRRDCRHLKGLAEHGLIEREVP